MIKARGEALRRQAGNRVMNFLHPMFHGQSYHAGSRIDIERLLPATLDDEDLEMLLEDFSEPSRFTERLSPVGMQVGEESVRGKNFTDMLVKSYRVFARIYSMVTMSIEQALRNNFREKGMVPFQSMGLDIDFLHRVIEEDHAISENTYGKFMDLFGTGVLAPCRASPTNTTSASCCGSACASTGPSSGATSTTSVPPTTSTSSPASSGSPRAASPTASSISSTRNSRCVPRRTTSPTPTSSSCSTITRPSMATTTSS